MVQKVIHELEQLRKMLYDVNTNFYSHKTVSILQKMVANFHESLDSDPEYYMQITEDDYSKFKYLEELLNTKINEHKI